MIQMSVVIAMHDIRSHGHVVSASYSRLEISWLLETDCGLSESLVANIRRVPQFRLLGLSLSKPQIKSGS